MSIELIAILIVIVTIVAISSHTKKKPDKQTDKPQEKPEPVKPAPVIPDSPEKNGRKVTGENTGDYRERWSDTERGVRVAETRS